jgi:hypothetical protein
MQNWGKENIFKPTIGNVSLNQDSNDNGIRIINTATLKNLSVKKIMFPYRNIRKYTWNSPDREIRNGIGVCSMYDLSVELTVILITVWWLQKFGKD